MSLHRVWRLGANIDTDALAPGAYMKLGIDQIARHCLENRYPDLAGSLRPGDVLVAEENFGIGSSREQAVGVLVHLGVKAVIAPSFSGLYFRNAYNLGLLAIVCEDAGRIPDGAKVDIDAANALVRVWPADTADDASTPPLLELPCQKIPDFLIERALSGGLMRQLERQYLHDKP
ncbi:MAG: 3-isopropylmalate dehydratase [Burkholderiaceae bacterium]